MRRVMVLVLVAAVIGCVSARSNGDHSELRAFFGDEEYTVYPDVGRIAEGQTVSLAAIPVDTSDFIARPMPEDIVAALKFVVFREVSGRAEILLSVDGREIKNVTGEYLEDPEGITDRLLAWGISFLPVNVGNRIYTDSYVPTGKGEGPNFEWNPDEGRYELYNPMDYR